VARLAMGELEAAVMEILWDRGSWLTPGEVREVLAKERPISYTTVNTIIRRLWRKERLVRQPDGRAFAYRPKQDREAYAASQMAKILSALKNRPAALSHFVAGLNPRDKSQLQRLLNEHKREVGR
jgi:predicted transcriptional regulator